MKTIRLTDTTSTNDYLLQNASLLGEVGGESRILPRPGEQEEAVCVVSAYQSAGKGMGMNTWESEPGKNLLFSILIHPTWLDASMQYLLSMAEALAVCDILSEYTKGITIKWPNDIYWRDRKISGTRIDGIIKGRRMKDMVIGTGINVNQAIFHSDAPNPVSLLNITGCEHDCDELLCKILDRFDHYLSIAEVEWTQDRTTETISTLYHSRLYRRTGLHPYQDAFGQFLASLLRVEPDGTLLLRRSDGTVSRYEFKEVKFINATNLQM